MTNALIDLVRALTNLAVEATLMLKQTRKHDQESYDRAAKARGEHLGEHIELFL